MIEPAIKRTKKRLKTVSFFKTQLLGRVKNSLNVAHYSRCPLPHQLLFTRFEGLGH